MFILQKSSTFQSSYLLGGLQVQRADNVLLLGPSGTGKTHIAHAIGHQLVADGVRCKVFPAVGLVQHLQQAKRDLVG